MRHSKYTQELLEDAVAASFSVAGVLRYLGIPGSGGMHAHISRRIRHYRIDTSHFLGSGHLRGTVSSRRLPAAQILVLNEPGSARVKPRLLRRALLEIGIPYECAVCSLSGEWQGLPLVLHVDHVNGNHLDSRCENLRFLCPNCHTQTASWAGKNKTVRSYRSPPAIGGPVSVVGALPLVAPAPPRAS